MARYAGIDIGTTRTKAVVYDAGAGTVVARAAVSTPVRRRPSGDVRDPAAVVAAARQVLTETVAAGGGIAALAVASVGEEVVLLDGEGAPIGEVLTWYGPHGAQERDQLAGERGAQAVAGLDPSFSVCKLAWLRRHRPGELARARTWTDLSGFVAAQLLGGGLEGVRVDLSHASRTGLLDLGGRAWDRAVLDQLSLGDLPLPPLTPSGTMIGEGVVSGGHDHFCGAYAAGVRRPGQAFLSAGTSEAQVVLTREPPGPGVDGGCFVTGDLYYAHLPTPAGRLYQGWRDLLYAEADDDQVMAEVVEVPEGSGGVTVRFDRAGARTTLADVPLDVTRGVLLRALMEGLAGEAERTTDTLERATGERISEIVVAGPPATSPAWRALRTRASTRALRFSDEPEAGALGAALLAELGAINVSRDCEGDPTGDPIERTTVDQGALPDTDRPATTQR